MSPEGKEEIINSIKITNQTRTFLSNMESNFGNLIKNTRKDTEKCPDFLGWGRLSNGNVIYIQGTLKETNGRLSVPLKIVEVPPEMIGEEEVTNVTVPSYRSKVDRFLEE